MKKNSNGHLYWLTNNQEMFEVNGQIFIAPVDNPFDLRGYRQGARWECTMKHLNQYFESVYSKLIEW